VITTKKVKKEPAAQKFQMQEISTYNVYNYEMSLSLIHPDKTNL